MNSGATSHICPEKRLALPYELSKERDEQGTAGKSMYDIPASLGVGGTVCMWFRPLEAPGTDWSPNEVRAAAAAASLSDIEQAASVQGTFAP